jgi:hypothetical protein
MLRNIAARQSGKSITSADLVGTGFSTVEARCPIMISNASTLSGHPGWVTKCQISPTSSSNVRAAIVADRVVRRALDSVLHDVARSQHRERLSRHVMSMKRAEDRASAAIQHQLIARRDDKRFGKSITSPDACWMRFSRQTEHRMRSR